MSGIVDRFPPLLRRAVFDAIRAMAWADGRLEREEILAVAAAAKTLKLPDDALDRLDEGAPNLALIAAAPLSAEERGIVYGCAAWFALVDAYEAPAEAGLLGALRTALAITEADAETLRERAREHYRVTTPDVPWWEELERLLGALHAKS